MKATFVQTLMYYDGPQVVLLKFGKTGANLVAVAIEKEGMEYPFFGCVVRKKNWEKYVEGKADLFYLFANATEGHRYFFDLARLEDDEASLTKASDVALGDPNIWPERGFFATYHSEPLEEAPEFDNDIQEFNIDGTWEAVDFSSFYGKISDVYAIFFLRDLFGCAQSAIDVREKAKAAVLARLWQGGGSYTGFYGALGDSVPSMSRLRVNKIQYASPGTIELRGREDIFEDMLTSLSLFEGTSKVAKEAYRYVDEMLSKEGLKRARPDATFSAQAIVDAVKEKCRAMFQGIGLEGCDEFYEICDRNTLLFAKLTLSIYRRFKGIHDFIAEGRIGVAPRVDIPRQNG